MSKEYLEAFGRITLHTEYDNDGSYDSLNFEDDCKLVDEALERLEQIDNANPNEAMKHLEFICKILKEKRTIDVKWVFKEDYNIILQALLKAQEPKQYLKWEDLEFTNELQSKEVILNGRKYIVEYKYCNILGEMEQVVWLINANDYMRVHKFYDTTQYFFNDLRLEMVE